MPIGCRKVTAVVLRWALDSISSEPTPSAEKHQLWTHTVCDLHQLWTHTGRGLQRAQAHLKH